MADFADLAQRAADMQRLVEELKVKCEAFESAACGVQMSLGDRTALMLVNAAVGAALDEAAHNASRLAKGVHETTARRKPAKGGHHG